MIYKDLTQEEKNKLAIQYKPLVNKLVNQWYKKGLTTWDQLESMAYEGLALAINTYDDEKSKMNFMQYAAFAIRNNILTSLDNELRTVKMSNYMQKKATEKGDTLFNTVSMDGMITENDKDWRNRGDYALGHKASIAISTRPKFADGDVFEYVCDRLESQFPDRDCKMFYKAFGLKGYDDMKGKDIAQEYGVSEGLVSQKIKKITSWIRKDTEMCEMLQNLL